MMILILLPIFILSPINNSNSITYQKKSLNFAVEWSIEYTDHFTGTPMVIDINNDNLLEILIGSKDGLMYCFDNTGEIIWLFTTYGEIWSTPAVCDIDTDGFLDIVVGSVDNSIYCLNHAGTLKWSFASNHYIHSSPLIADLDNDEYMEIVFTSQDKNIYCLNYLGEELWSFDTGNPMYSNGVIADINNDNKHEIICRSYNKTICFTLPDVLSSGSSPWACFRGSTLHTGWMDSDSDFIDDLTDSYIC